MSIAVKDKKAFGLLIKNQREKDKKSLRGLAAECEMNYVTLYDIENGNGFPTEEVVIKIVNQLNFKSKAYVFDKYAKCKQTAPPDVAKYLTGNDKVVAWIRRMMEEDKTNKGADI